VRDLTEFCVEPLRTCARNVLRHYVVDGSREHDALEALGDRFESVVRARAVEWVDELVLQTVERGEEGT